MFVDVGQIISSYTLETALDASQPAGVGTPRRRGHGWGKGSGCMA
jgi:hypothetical protein